MISASRRDSLGADARGRARTVAHAPRFSRAIGGDPSARRGTRLAVVRRSVDPTRNQELKMGSVANRGEGVAEQVGGKIKEGIGKLTGNEQMQAEGEAKEAKGEAREEAAKASERAKGTTQELGGTVKNRVGAAIGNEQMQAEGKAKELEGEAREKANR